MPSCYPHPHICAVRCSPRYREWSDGHRPKSAAHPACTSRREYNRDPCRRAERLRRNPAGPVAGIGVIGNGGGHDLNLGRAGEEHELVDLVAGNIGDDAAVSFALEEPLRADLAFRRCGPRPTVWMTRPMAPWATSSAALVTLGTSKRSEKSIVQMRLVFATVWRRRSSCSKVVQPGLSDMTSLRLPWRRSRDRHALTGYRRSRPDRWSRQQGGLFRCSARHIWKAFDEAFHDVGLALCPPAGKFRAGVHQFWAMPKMCRCSIPRATNLIALLILQFHFLAGVGRVDDRVDQSVRQKSRFTGDDRRAS